MSSEESNEPTENGEGHSAPLRVHSSPYDYQVVVTSEGRSLDLYNGRLPTNAMSAYGEALLVTKFLGQLNKVATSTVVGKPLVTEDYYSC